MPRFNKRSGLWMLDQMKGLVDSLDAVHNYKGGILSSSSLGKMSVQQGVKLGMQEDEKCETA